MRISVGAWAATSCAGRGGADGPGARDVLDRCALAAGGPLSATCDERRGGAGSPAPHLVVAALPQQPVGGGGRLAVGSRRVTISG